MAGKQQEQQLQKHMQLEAKYVPSSASLCSHVADRSALLFVNMCMFIPISLRTGNAST